MGVSWSPLAGLSVTWSAARFSSAVLCSATRVSVLNQLGGPPAVSPVDSAILYARCADPLREGENFLAEGNSLIRSQPAMERFNLELRSMDS